MASQITIDMSGMGDKIVAAIHDAMEKMVEAKVADAVNTATTAIKKENEEEEKSVPELDMAGMHRQIISNAKHLFPLLARRPVYHEHTFDVVTSGSAGFVHAAVLFMEGGISRLLLKGPDAPSEAMALQELLIMTSEQMEEQNLDGYKLPGHSGSEWLENGWSKGVYYTADQ